MGFHWSEDQQTHPPMDLHFLLPLFFFFFFFFCFFFFFLKPNPPSTNFTPLRSYPIIGNIPHLLKKRSCLLQWSSHLIPLSPTSTSTVSPFVFTANPSNLEHMLRSNFVNYPKGGFITSTMHDFLGHGIFNSNDDLWRLQRKAASFEFNTKSIRAFIVDIVRCEVAQSLLPLLHRARVGGQVVDLQDVLERFAFDNVCSLAFGYDPKGLDGTCEEGLRFFHAFDDASRIVVQRAAGAFPFFWKIKKMLDVGSERQLRKSVAIVREMVLRFVRSRRENDLVSRFAAESMDEQLLCDIAINFMVAGRDTTPSALTWFFWMVSSRPDITRKIRDEIGSIRTKSSDQVFGIEELKEMQYLHAALSESMRLYPPVPILPRFAKEDDVLPDGTVVRAGWMLMYSAYAMGRMESIWGEDCMEMKPERWLEDGVYQPTSPFKYPVFHGGPRMCLGKEMAYIQMKAVAACVLERFDVEVAEERGEPELLMTMRMKDGLPVRIKEKV